MVNGCQIQIKIKYQDVRHILSLLTYMFNIVRISLMNIVAPSLWVINVIARADVDGCCNKSMDVKLDSYIPPCQSRHDNNKFWKKCIPTFSIISFCQNAFKKFGHLYYYLSRLKTKPTKWHLPSLIRVFTVCSMGS